MQLPPGWSEAKDPRSGATYFFNASTGQTQWDRPVAAPWQQPGAGAAATAHAAAAAAAAPPAALQAQQVQQAEQPMYLPAMQFGGAREGYVFKTGPSGLGYYLDRPWVNRRLGELTGWLL